jgi:hypothetical protein
VPKEDKEAVKKVRSQIGRRYVDASLLTVNVVGGVVHLTGVIAKLRTHPDIELREEMERISHILRQQPGIRDVVWDVTQRT